MHMTEAVDAARSVRRIQRSIALVLWLLAGLALWYVWRERSILTERKPGETASESNDALVSPFQQVVEDSRTQSAEADSREKKTDVTASSKSKMLWNPNGIEDFQLTERSGRTISKKDLLGHEWTVCFVFTRCAGPCPKVTGQMRLLQERLKGTDVRLVTITVDPKFDTPEVLREYADDFGADSDRWLFLTGDQQKIYHLIQHSFKMPVKEMIGEDRRPGFEVLHTTNVLHVNSRGRVVGKYNALVDSEMASLRRALLKSAKAGASTSIEAKEPAVAPRPMFESGGR